MIHSAVGNLTSRYRARSIVLAATIILGLALIAMPLVSANAQVEVEVPGQGKVLTTTKVENGVLGVTNSLTRTKGFGRDCSGACYYVSATKAKAWTCKGNTVCRIDCAGREPVGACPAN